MIQTVLHVLNVRSGVPGTLVVPIALSQALDGGDSSDYLQRVEPSIQGGRKMAELILSKLDMVRFGADSAKDGAPSGSSAMEDQICRNIEAQTQARAF